MRAFIIVERQVLPDGSLVDPWFLLQVVETFFLNGPVESLQMGIVIRSSDSAESVCCFRKLREVPGELRPMICLEHFECERGMFLRLTQKADGTTGSDPR